MKIFAPSYYKKFSCIADKCKHSCCVGWEIDIDEATYEAYKKIDTDFGEKLNDNIVFNDDCAYFKLTHNERCPFLNENNLCEIILNLGENALCQICNDHPRFRNFYGDRVEIGLGLTCEEATRIIINENDRFELVEIEINDESVNIYDDESEFFKIRDKIFKIIEDEESFETIIEKILSDFQIKAPEISIYELIDTYLNFEILDITWVEMLKKLKECNDTQFTLPCPHKKQLKNLLTYFIYRHLGECLYDGDFNGRLLFAITSCTIISELCKIGYSVEDVARMYSSEIEYSNENLNNLIDFLQEKSLEN